MHVWTRRRLLAAGSGLALTGIPLRSIAQSATPISSPVPAAGVQPDGSWVFTDDTGRVITRPHLPTRIIAQSSSAGALWDFGIRPVGIYVPTRNPDGTPNFAVGNVDLDEVADLGDYPEIDLEQVVAADAELYVDLDRGNGIAWYLTEDTSSALSEMLDILLINAAAIPVIDTIRHFEVLAIALGTDPKLPSVSAAKAELREAEQALQAAIAAKPGLTVLAISGEPSTSLYICNPEVIGDLMYYRDLGLDLVVPDAPDPSTLNNFEVVSWEQLGTYAPDIVLYDSRSWDDFRQIFEEDSVWQSLAAIQAGQVGLWEGTVPYSYHYLAAAARNLTETIRRADVLPK